MGNLGGSHCRIPPAIEKSWHGKDAGYHQNDHVLRRHDDFNQFLDPRVS